MISQLVPASDGQVGGYIRITSDAPVATLALFGTNDLRSLSTITPQVIK